MTQSFRRELENYAGQLKQARRTVEVTHSSSLHVQAENGAKKSQTTIHPHAMNSSRCGRRCRLVLNTISYSPFAVTTRHALMLRENVTLWRHSHAGWWGDSAGVLQPRHR